MAIDKIYNISGTVIPMVGDDIDTDRIIPARYLKCVTFDGLGEFAFYDERFDANGKSLGHPIDKYKGGSIILSGNNFGCGSSREHAPQSIKRAGINAVIAESYAEIFFGNSVTLGIICTYLKKEEIAEIEKLVISDSKIEISIDVEKNILSAGGKQYSAGIPEGARQAFLKGTYDSLSELLMGMDDIKQLESSLPYRFS